MKSTLKIGLFIFLVIFLFSSIFLSSFAAEKEYKIYVVVHGGIADPAWLLNYRGAKAAAELYPDIDLHYVGPADYNFEEFMAFIVTAINSKPDALVCTLTSPEAMDDILRPAIQEGLPVIAINAPDARPSKERIPVLTYVGISSFYEAGALPALTVLKYFMPNLPKRALYINHHPGAFHIEEAGKGFVETMKAAGVPCEQLVVGPDPILAAELTISYLKAHPDTQAIAHPNVTLLETLVVRLKDEGEGYKPGKDIVLGTVFDPSEGCLDLMEKGEVLFANDQQMYLQGFYGVLFAYMKAKYNFAPPLPPVGTGPIVLTKQDVPIVRELIKEGYR